MPVCKTKISIPAGLPTKAQAEAHAKVLRRQLHRLAAEGRLTKRYFGHRLRWDADELDALPTRLCSGGRGRGRVGRSQARG